MQRRRQRGDGIGNGGSMTAAVAAWRQRGRQQGGSAASAAESLQRGLAAAAAWLPCGGGGLPMAKAFLTVWEAMHHK